MTTPPRRDSIGCLFLAGAVRLSVTQLQAKAPPPAPSATEACSAPAPPSAPLPPLPVRSGGQSRQGRLRDVSVRGRSWGQAWVLGVPVGAAGQVGQAGKLGGRTVGLRSPGHRGGLQGCDEGTASCNRELQSYPPPPQRNLFPASQMRELARERQPHSTPLTPPSPVQALGLGASTAEYTWHWHVTLGTPGPQSCCEEGVGCRFRQSQPGLRKELFSFLLVLSDLLV